MPMAVFALVSWLKNPYNGNKAEVKVNQITWKEHACMWMMTVVVTAVFYVILDYFHTANILPSTISFLRCILLFAEVPILHWHMRRTIWC